MVTRHSLVLAMLLLVACRPAEPEDVDAANVEAEATATVPAAVNEVEDTVPPRAVPADPTSPAAAAELVIRYGDLLEQRRFGEARELWGDNAPSEAEFAAAFDRYSTIDASMGTPGAMEGAAGSIFVDVPMTLSGTLKSGGPYSLSGPLTLRRVNDVPGSTAEQRRWHIYASGLKPAT